MSNSPGDLGGAAIVAPAARPGLAPPVAAALPVLLLLVLLATVVSYNTPRAIRLSPADETRQIFFGFHGLERAGDELFRWTDGDARVCFEQIGRVSDAVASVRVLGAGANALGRAEVQFAVNGAPIAAAPIQGATRIYHLHLGDALASHDDDCIGIMSDAAPAPGDVRSLGVPFGGLTLSPLTTQRFTWPALAQLGLNLAVAALVFWLLCQVGVSPWVAASGVAAMAGLITLAIRADLSVPGLGVARHMLPLTLGLAAVALAGAALRRTQALRAGLPLLARDLLGMLFWSALLVGLTELFQRLLGYGGVWPLKAGYFPMLTPLALLPAALCACWGWLVLRRLDGAGPGGFGRGVLLVLLGGLLLTVSLKASVRGWETLFATFTANPYEYIADVPRVGDDPAGFLRRFVAIKDELALHSSTHPPGSILLLWGVERLIAPGPVAASWVAIGLSALAPLAALWLGYRLEGPRLALLAGAIAAVMPGQLVYSTTSMDGVFNMLLAMGAAAFLLALEPGARRWEAALAGLLIAAGLFFTYAATQLAFFGAAVALVALMRPRPPSPHPRVPASSARLVLTRCLLAAGTIALLYGGLWLATGYNVAEGAVRATAINAEVMRGVRARPFLPPSLAYYTLFLVANLLAFGWYLGPWGLRAVGSAGSTALRRRPLDGVSALAAGLAALLAGMALSGLFNREVERIWGFAYPLLAVLIARHALRGDARTQRWRAGLFLGLVFAHGLAIRLLLSTFW